MGSRKHHLRVIALAILVGLGLCLAHQDDVTVEKDRKVKGQQYVSQTVVAKVIGPNGFSKGFLDMLRNGDTRIVVDNMTLVDGPNGTTSALVTENVKTTVTRITIPLSTSFMDSDWYRETLRKFLQKNRLSFANSTGEKEYLESGKVDLDLIILKLWAAATLRDNIVTVFGTLLYNTDQVLPFDLHSSLAHLYQLTRLRRISTVGFLDALENMSFETPQEQFKILFQKLEKNAPKYLRSCVTYWLENLYGNLVNMTLLLTNSDGVLVADFLSGIDSSALLPIKEKVLFPKQAVVGHESENEELIGKMLSRVLAGVFDHSIPLTRQLFAGILLHLPLNKFTPEADEYQRFYVDSVKMGNPHEDRQFQYAVGKLDFRRFSNPYELVKAVCRTLISERLGDRALYETILVHIQQATNTFSLRDYDVMAPIIHSDKINMDVLLNSIVSDEYPPDIVDAKDRLLYYIDKNYIDFDFVLRGFIKHQQRTPTELLIAALTRIEVRSTNLFPELLMTLTSLRTHIIYKQALNNLRVTLSVNDVTALLLSFQSPNLPSQLREVAADLRVLLQSEFIDPGHQLNKQSTDKCISPRQCVITVLKYLLAKGQIRNRMCEMKARELVRLVNSDGEPVPGQRSLGGNNECLCLPHSYGTRTENHFRYVKDPKPINDGHGAKEIYPGKFSPSPYKNNNVGGDVYEKPLFISKLESGKVMVHAYNGEVFYASRTPELVEVNFTTVPIPHPGWANNDSNVKLLLPIMSSEQQKFLSPIAALLQKQHLTDILNVNPSSYPSRGPLLQDILQASMKNPQVFDDESQKKFAEFYLRVLNYAYTALPPPPPASSRQFRHEVNLPSLLHAVPMPTDPDSERKFKLLRTLLTQTNLSGVKQQIQTREYPSKGAYLKVLLKLLLRNGTVKDEETIATIRYFEGKVMTSGYGAQPVDWVIVMEGRSE